MTRRLLATPLLALLLACASPVLHAAPPSDAEVDRLMELTRVRSTLDGMWPQLEAMQQQIVAQVQAEQGVSPSAEEQAELDALLRRQTATMREAMSWERVQPIYREIYQQTFDAADVEAMIAFYESDAGQNLVAKTPLLMQNTMLATQKLLGPMIEQMQQDIQATAAQRGTPADDTP